MRSRLRAIVLLLCAACAGPACRERGTAEQDTRPLPTPEPPATAAASSPASRETRDEASVPKKKPAADAEEGTGRQRPSGDGTDSGQARGVGGSAGSLPSPGSGGSTAGAAPAVTPTTPSALPGVTAPSPACLSRCQGAMQGCLSTPVDAGVPGFANLELCKKAFEACQAACKP